MSPAASHALLRLLNGETLHVGAGPKGKSIRRATAKELEGHVEWTDYDNRGDRPDFETVSDLRVYCPTCDACHKRFSASALKMSEDGLALCPSCTTLHRGAP